MDTDTSPTLLITGGAGFIGSHLASELLQHGYHVRILDNLTPQVHGSERLRPRHLDRRAEVAVGDIRDSQSVQEALEGVDSVIHLAAVVGERASMYQLEKFMNVNSTGMRKKPAPRRSAARATPWRPAPAPAPGPPMRQAYPASKIFIIPI